MRNSKRDVLLGTVAVIGILFGLLLYWFDLKGKRTRDEYSVNWKDALIALPTCSVTRRPIPSGTSISRRSTSSLPHWHPIPRSYNSASQQSATARYAR